MNKKSKILGLLLLGILIFGISFSVKGDELPDDGTYIERCGLVEEEYEIPYETLKDSVLQIERINASNAEVQYWSRYGSRHYYNQLTDAEKRIWDALEERCIYYITTTNNVGVVSGSYVITAEVEGVDSLTSNEIYNVIWMFKYSNPQYYFLSNAALQGKSGIRCIVGIQVYDEFAAGAQRSQYTNKFKAKLDAWVSQVAAGEREENKVKIAHDIIALNTTYGENDYDQSAYSMVCLGQTVCAGYAATLQLLLNPMGIETVEVTSSNHGWNYVKIHDYWYGIDVTWDDGVTADGVYYNYYNKSQKGLEYNNSSHFPTARWQGYYPIAAYDSTESDAYHYYPAYFTSNDYVYFKVNDNVKLNSLYAKVVDTLLIDAELSDAPSSVSNFEKTYSVIKPKPDRVKGFVRRMYTVALNRESDLSGLTFWTAQLREGKRDGASVAKGFLLSPEIERQNLSNEEYVIRLYQTLLDRTPTKEDAGKAFWINLLENGVSRAYVFRGFCHSDEFTRICSDYGITRGTVVLSENRDQNSDITMYVFRCYERTLGRIPDTSGMNYWTGQILTKERNPIAVASNFVFSAEFKSRNYSNEEYVKILYRMFFDREADKTGFDFWVGELASGKRDRYNVFMWFANSPEFKAVLKTFGL